MRCIKLPSVLKCCQRVCFGESEDFLVGVQMWSEHEDEEADEKQDGDDDLLAKLENAVAVDDITKVLEILDTEPQLARSCGPNGQQSLLHRAAYHGARDVAMTCLYSLELTNVLKCIDVNINDEDYEMTRPLYWAVRGGHVKVVKLLLEAGAAKTWLNVFGDSAVHIAVRYQQEPTLRLLMEKGCSVNVINAAGQTPLHLLMQHSAQFDSHQFEAMLFTLLEEADINQSNGDMSALHYVIEQGGTCKMLRILLSHGIDWSQSVYQDRPLLDHCIHYGRTDLLEILLTHITDKTSLTTALHTAVDSGLLTDIHLLVAAGADVNNVQPTCKILKKKTKSHTMMHRAFMQRDFQTARYLVDHGANPTIDCLPDYLLRMGHSFTQWYSYNRENPMSVNFSLMTHCHLEVLYLLQQTVLRYPSMANYVCKESQTSALWIACSSGMLCLAVLLIQHGADIHSKNRDGTSVLQRLMDCRSNQYIKQWKLSSLHRLVHTVIHCITDFSREPWLRDALDVWTTASKWPRDIRNVLEDRLTVPASLRALSRASIFSQLHGERQSSVRSLGLPRLLQDYLLYKELHELQYELIGLQPDNSNQGDQSASNHGDQQQCLCLFLQQQQ